jgi:hypothetical protein
MPRYYFNEHLNGRQSAQDRRGRQFASHKEACEHAVRRMPIALGKVVLPTCDTFFQLSYLTATESSV